MTPTMKIKWKFVNEAFKDLIEAMYWGLKGVIQRRELLIVDNLSL